MTIKPFKIKRKHLEQYPELHKSDVGMYAFQISDEQGLMMYETEQVANKAFEYFQKNFKTSGRSK